MRTFVFAISLCAAAVPAFAQPFTNAKTALSNYSVADTMPGKPCESLSAYKGEGIVSINARVVPATADTPQHCRVTGVITPEVAFEINLPDRWNPATNENILWKTAIPGLAHSSPIVWGDTIFVTSAITSGAERCRGLRTDGHVAPVNLRRSSRRGWRTRR